MQHPEADVQSSDGFLRFGYNLGKWSKLSKTTVTKNNDDGFYTIVIKQRKTICCIPTLKEVHRNEEATLLELQFYRVPMGRLKLGPGVPPEYKPRRSYQIWYN